MYIWNMLPDISNNTKRQDRPGALFKIKCSEFQATYIGETGRNLTTRLTEHKRASRKATKKVDYNIA